MTPTDNETKRLLKLILGLTIFFWLLQAFSIQTPYFLSRSTNTISLLFQAPLSALTPVTSPLSVNTLFDLGLSCLIIRFFSSFIAPFLGKRSFWTLLIVATYIQAFFALHFLKGPISLTNSLMLGLATFFCTLSGGRPLMMLFIPILPAHILLLAISFWFIGPILMGYHAEAAASLGSFLTFYLCAIALYKQNLPFVCTNQIDYTIRKGYNIARSFFDWKILPILNVFRRKNKRD